MCRLGDIIYDTHVDIWPVDRERAFVLSDHHRHLSEHGVFLQQTKKSVDKKKKERERETGLLTLYAAVKSCEML